MTQRDPEEYARMKKAAWSFLCWPLGLVFCGLAVYLMATGPKGENWPAASWALLGMLMLFVQVCWQGVVMTKKLTVGDVTVCACCGIGVLNCLIVAFAPLSQQGSYIMLLLTFIPVLCSTWIAEGMDRLFGKGNRI